MATELMEFRVGDEFANNRLWLRHEVGNPQIVMIAHDSQWGDQELVLNEGNIAQLRSWLEEVDRRTWTD